MYANPEQSAVALPSTLNGMVVRDPLTVASEGCPCVSVDMRPVPVVVASGKLNSKDVIAAAMGSDCDAHEPPAHAGIQPAARAGLPLQIKMMSPARANARFATVGILRRIEGRAETLIRATFGKMDVGPPLGAMHG